MIRDELGGAHEHRTQELIQERYSMRCLPQFLGPIVEGIELVARQLEIEINSANDNPLIDVDAQASFHGGNFLGEYVAIGMDQLRYYIGLMAKHLDVQIGVLGTPEFNRGLAPSLVGNTNRTYNMGLKGLQLTANSMIPMPAISRNFGCRSFPNLCRTIQSKH